MKKITYLVIGLFLSMFASCNYLNIEPYLNDLMTDDSVFTNKLYIQRYIYGAAAYLPQEGNLICKSASPAGTATDETVISWKLSDYMGMYLLLDEVNAYTDFYNNWEHYYQGIRKVNTVLTRMGEAQSLTVAEANELRGQCYFLRAYFYMLLWEKYGPVPIMPDEPLDLTLPNDELSHERATYDETVDYICNDFEQAAELLPKARVVSAIDMPTSGAALAFASRVRLTAASPQYNGNVYYSQWTRKSDGVNYINTTKDNSKWAQAAYYAKQVIDQNIYSIYTAASDANTRPLPEGVPNTPFPNGAGGIDPYHSYKDMFDGTVPDEQNTELIYRSGISDDEIKICMPVLFNGWSGLGVTQNLVDMYRMSDGKDIKESADYKPTEFKSVGQIDYATNYSLRGELSCMYLDREPRFYATIGFSGRYWDGSSNQTEASRRGQQIWYYKDGNGGMNQAASGSDNYLLTGYTSVKYIYYTDNNYLGTFQAKSFPVIRYAEVLLNYVEALNNLEGSYEINGQKFERNEQEMVTYFNMIRYRGGLPGITNADAENPERMQELIERERAVEFALEGRRYHDMRRWGKAAVFGEPVYGLNINSRANQKEQFYRPSILTHAYATRIYKPKMVFTPIPDGIMRRNLKLDQNPDW